jgi:hypothetical protein
MIRYKAVEVEIALAVAVGADVHLHAVDVGREVGPVIEVEAAQEVLVGLAAARMLRGDHPRYRLQQFGGAQQRSHEQVAAADRPLARGVGDADLGLAAAEDDHIRGDRALCRSAVGRGHRRRCRGSCRRLHLRDRHGGRVDKAHRQREA